MTATARFRDDIRELRILAIIGVITIVAGYLGWFAIVHLGLLSALFDSPTLDTDPTPTSGSGSQWGVYIESMTTPWQVPLGIAGTCSIVAFVYGIIVGSTSRTEIAAGRTRRSTVRRATMDLGAVAAVVAGLFTIAVLPALILDPAPALYGASLHPIVVLPGVTFSVAAAALLGQLIAHTFLRLPWYIGVLGCAALLGVLIALTAEQGLPPVATYTVSLVASIAAGVFAYSASHKLVSGLEV